MPFFHLVECTPFDPAQFGPYRGGVPPQPGQTGPGFRPLCLFLCVYFYQLTVNLEIGECLGTTTPDSTKSPPPPGCSCCPVGAQCLVPDPPCCSEDPVASTEGPADTTAQPDSTESPPSPACTGCCPVGVQCSVADPPCCSLELETQISSALPLFSSVAAVGCFASAFGLLLA